MPVAAVAGVAGALAHGADRASASHDRAVHTRNGLHSMSWLEVWIKIVKNAKRTGGTVFVVRRADGRRGAYGCAQKGPGSLDGQAQEGEEDFATGHSCTIEWVPSQPSSQSLPVLRVAYFRAAALLLRPVSHLPPLGKTLLIGVRGLTGDTHSEASWPRTNTSDAHRLCHNKQRLIT
eukprot:COSAG02_NODE_4689_length_5091_cov_1.795072_8_plen_177_part_00